MKWKILHEEEDGQNDLLKKDWIDLDTLILNIVDENLAEESMGTTIAYGILAFVLSASGVVRGSEFRKEMMNLVQDK